MQPPATGHGCQKNGAIYATVDVSKKRKHAEPATGPNHSSNYMNLEPAVTTTTNAAMTTDSNGRKPSADNYMNLDFSESLCHYENAKHVLTKAGLINTCDKCGHQKRFTEEGGMAGGVGGDEKSGDYMTMEPVNGRMTEIKRNLFPGYLPMCPATAGANNNKQQELLKNIMNKGLAEKSASIPSLNEYKSPADGLSMKNKNLSRVDEPRKRSSSAGSSSRYGEGEEPLSVGATSDLHSNSSRGASNHTSSAESMTSQIAKICPATTTASSSTTTSTASTISADGSTATNMCTTAGIKDNNQQAALVHIRRSSSVPCKNNRDSSSSNDSGVSTGSLRYRGSDFAEFELPLTTAMSTMRHRRTMATAECDSLPTTCVHGSLPRRSKSTDRLKELSFRFQKFVGPMKSSSAGAEVPVCLKKDKGQFTHQFLYTFLSYLQSLCRNCDLSRSIYFIHSQDLKLKTKFIFKNSSSLLKLITIVFLC